ncbi:MAG: MFS transporter [Armatimonadota bacterium]
MPEEPPTAAADSTARLQAWQRRIVFILWITYFGFYFCRKNISAALKGIELDLGIDNTQLGILASCLAIAYGIGQFVNGQLGDRFGARRLVTIGMCGSVLMNIAFGFARTMNVMKVLWTANGFFQSMGWAPITKTLANWMPPSRRGRYSGILGTSYQFGDAATLWATGVLLAGLHWQWMFWVPSGFVALVALHFALRVRNAPEEVGLATVEEQDAGETGAREVEADEHLGFAYTLRRTVANRHVWLVGMAFFCLDIIRWGFFFWSVKMLMDMQGDVATKATLVKATIKAAIIPLGGSLGAISAGWITDRCFGGRRAPVVCIMMLGLAAAAYLFGQLPRGDALSVRLLLYALLAIIGFLTYGPHVLMVGTMAMDFGTRKAASAAAGFIDALGYAGVGVGMVATGRIVDHYSAIGGDVAGWQAALLFWCGAAIVSAVLMATLWRHKPAKGAYH